MNWIFKKAWAFKMAINLWPPFFFTGIKLIYMSEDFRESKVRMTLNRWNANAVGSHFGGSLFSMTDPFYMLMLMARIGDKYHVWDKSAEIDFIKPGRGTVYAEFVLTDKLLEQIKTKTQNGDKFLPEITVHVVDGQGELIAKVNKVLYVRAKKQFREDNNT